MSNPLIDHMNREFRRFLVQRHIVCPITGDLLDMDDSVFINDCHDEPVGVFSQAGWAKILEVSEARGAAPLAAGYHVDESTVK